MHDSEFGRSRSCAAFASESALLFRLSQSLDQCEKKPAEYGEVLKHRHVAFHDRLQEQGLYLWSIFSSALKAYRGQITRHTSMMNGK